MRWTASRWTLPVLVLAALGLDGCGGRSSMPPLSGIADAPLLRQGSSWTYRVTDSSYAGPQMLRLTFEKEDIYRDMSVLVFNAGSETLYYDRDLNFVATLQNGRMLREAAPSYRAFDFPFYVGKEWRSVFTFQDLARTLSWSPVEVFWKVKEYDVVKVPAGDFRAFRLVSDPSTNWGLEEEIWFAPEVKQVAKWSHVRTAKHYLGKGKQTGELVQYALK
jgi:hypothetical protein